MSNMKLLYLVLMIFNFIQNITSYDAYSFNDDIFNNLQMNFINEQSPLQRLASYFDGSRRFDDVHSFVNNAPSSGHVNAREAPITASHHHRNRHIVRHRLPRGGGHFHSESNRLNIQRPVGAIDTVKHEDGAGGKPVHHSSNLRHHHPEKSFFDANGRLNDALSHIPRETKNEATAHKHAAALTTAHIHDHNVDNVQLPSGVPHPSREAGAQFIKERLGHENSDGKPYGSKIKYSFRDPKAPNNYMEVTEVRMSMNRQYTHDHQEKGEHGKHGKSEGGAPHPGPPPLPPPPMPPHPIKPGASSFSPRSTLPSALERNDFDNFFSSTGNSDNMRHSFNSDTFNLPDERDVDTVDHFKCDHPSHASNEYNSPIIVEPSSHNRRNSFDNLYSVFARTAESSHSVSSLFNGNTSPSHSQVESFFSHSFFDDAYSF